MASTTNKRSLKQVESIVTKLINETSKKLPSKARRSRRGRSRRIAKAENKIAGLVNHAARYVDSLKRDILVPSLELPSTNYYGPCRKHYVQSRVQLNLANTANLHGGIVMNPMLAFMKYWYVQKNFANADVLCIIPTAYQHTTASTVTGLPYAGVSQPVDFNGRLSNDDQLPRAGKVRCLGVHFKIVHTGTVLNRGGSIVVFTNPQKMALACWAESAGAAAQPVTRFNVNGVIDQALDMVQVHQLEDEFSWTWRPTDLDFHDFTGYLPLEIDPAGSGTNPASYDYLSPDGAGAGVTPMGWTTGFEIRPAAGTQGAASQYYCDITAEYDLYEYIEAGTAAGPSTLMSQENRKADPVRAAHVQNALSEMHLQRRTIGLAPAAKSLALTAFKGFSKVARDAAVEAIGTRVASMF